MIFQAQEEIQRYYTELLWRVGGGSKVEFDQLLGTDVMEFFRILKIYQANLKTKQPNGNNKT